MRGWENALDLVPSDGHLEDGSPLTQSGAMTRSVLSLALLVMALAAWVHHAAGASYEQTVAESGSRSVRVGSADDGVAGAPPPDVTVQDDPLTTSATAARSLLQMSRENTRARPDFSEGIYHTKGEVFDEVKAIVAAHPDIMRIDTAQSTRGGYSSELLVVTVELAGLEEDDLGDESARLDDVNAGASGKVSGTGEDASAPKVEKTRVLYNFGQHGRELITVEVAVDLLRALADGAESAARLAHPDASESTRQTARALLATTFKIVPMENINGRDKVEAGQWCERKNGRGVDCNRNWEVDWGVKAPDFDPSEEYPGTAPFSEPEAFLMKTLLEEFEPHVWVNVHSGMEALFMPFDHKAEEPVGPGADAMKAILRQINAQNCGNRCVVGSGGRGVGYLAHGTATDHVYVKMRVPVTFTWEIYGDGDAHYLDCFRMFNPVERDRRDAVVDDWISAAIGLVPMTRAHPDVPMAGALIAEESAGGANADLEDVRSQAAHLDHASSVVADPSLDSGRDSGWYGDADAAVRVDELGWGARDSEGGTFGASEQENDGARSADVTRILPSRRFGSQFAAADGIDAASASAPFLTAAQTVFAAVAAALLASWCVAARRTRRARLAGQLATRGVRRLSP